MKPRLFILCVYLSTFIYISNGCDMEGVTQWLAPQNQEVKDIHRGLIISRTTTNIEAIIDTEFSGPTRGPYFQVSLVDSVYTITTTDAFANYEEYETIQAVTIRTNFRCTGGNTRPLVFLMNIKDTNNHSPVFKPTDNYNFPLALPVPPGFLVTGCDNLIVRDVDLTTTGIDFNIDDNPYFEIIYNGKIQDKEFGAVIRTKALIRSLPETSTLTISATDIDLTGDDRRTSYATVNIQANNMFSTEEPVFSEAFYKADYTADHNIVLRGNIMLQQGYDDQVQFDFDGEYADHFQLNVNGNDLSFSVIRPLPEDVSQSQLLLVIRATREYTSGATATVIVILPEARTLGFEAPFYNGRLENNVLTMDAILLNVGYDEDVTFQLAGEFATYFATNNVNGRVTISVRTQIPDEIILENKALMLTLSASGINAITATTNILLDVIKDDHITPVFEKAVYSGIYDSDTGLSLEQIVIRGYDDTVQISLVGDQAELFTINNEDGTVSLSGTVPAELWPEQSFLLTLQATKPRTVGANAAVQISLPKARELKFETTLYRGKLEYNILTLDDIVLTNGYDDNVSFEITGEFSSYFTLSNTDNKATISMRTEIPETVILGNNALLLTLSASGLNAITTSTNILLDVIKDDHITPVFEKAVYSGSYDSVSGLILEQIVIVQGYDDSVKLSLDGDHADLFTINQEGGTVRLSGTISAEIWPEQSLLLTLQAAKERTVGAITAIQITLPAARELRFDAASYNGKLENNVLTLGNILLSAGYDENVVFEISGEFSSYFTWSNVGNQVTISVQTELPETVVLEKNALLLTLSASGLNAISTSTNILLDIIKDDSITPVFEKAVYNGNYESVAGLTLEEIVFVQGYDSTVEISLVGDHAELFTTKQESGIVTVSGTIPAEIWPEQTLLLTLHATKPRSVGANTAIQITLPSARIISFEAPTYAGSVKDNSLTVEDIVLSVGYSKDIEFKIFGEFAHHFSLSNTDNKVTISLELPLSEDVILENNYIVLTLSASGLNAITTFTTVLLEIKKYDTTTPLFSKNIYDGKYIDSSNVNIESIKLIQGYDSTVIFRLDGDHAQYFEINDIENNVIITLKSTIPKDLIFNEKLLLFKVLAEKDLTVGASTVVAIQFPSDLTEPTVMKFSKNAYLGTLDDGTFKVIDNIILENGFGTGTVFELSGEYAEHFALTNSENVITISMRDSAPVEELDKNSFIILQIEAQQDRAVSVTTSLVIEVVSPDAIIFPVFEEPFYSGTYTTDDGLNFEQEIRLSTGFDDTVTFGLEGDSSKWFALEENGNSVLIIQNKDIPNDVIELNHQLLFTVVANKPGTPSGRSAISISLPKYQTEQVILRFEENSYIGQIDDGKLTLSPISLNKDTETVKFEITGEYADYFGVVKENTQITIKLISELPSDIESSFIVLNIEASHDAAISGHTTLVLEIINDDEPDVIIPVFENPYYIGEYSEESGLIFDSTIRLMQGFDESVTFTLEGDDSQGFILKYETPNNIILLLDEENLPVITNQNHLTFTINAHKPQSLSGRSAIIIQITEFSTDRYLQFSDDHFKGFVKEGILNLDVIALKEGYSEEVIFALTGDGRITLQLMSQLPPELDTNVIILTLEARTENHRTHATIIIEIIAPALKFEKPYYTGSYTDTNGLSFISLISLQSGYDDRVQFSLDGEHSTWFGLERISENSTALTLTSPIPSAVLANNRKLIFVITATRPGTVVARATIVISLIDEIASDLILGFEQVSYSGSIEHDKLTLEPIMLIEGFTQQVSFALLGDLATFFTVNTDGPTVRITLNGAIPEHNIPPNRIIILVLRASEPQALPAFATIVLAVERIPGPPPVEPPVFDEPYYTGHYTEEAGLSFDQLISLTSGSHHAVVFALDGDHSAWFGLERISENSTALTLTSPIPSAVLANNRKLIFVITATRPGTVVARATIVISLIDEIASDLILGFEQVSYSGSIEHDKLTLEPIMLIEGFTQQVSFALLGDLATFFTVNTDGPTVRVTLNGVIPEHNIPPNRIIILVLRASEPQALPAFATIVLAVERIPGPPPVEPPVFDEPYYTGHYTEEAGLSFDQLISLTSGSHHAVVFALDGDHSAWFGLERISENSTALTLTSPIPSAVLANNRKLIFVITATRPGTVVARATIVISLIDEIASDLILGFEQVSYSGSIEHDKLTLEPIMLIEGFTQQVSFALLGDLATFFTVNTDGPTVRITLNGAIPEHNIPPNRIIILVLRASEPQALPAFATIVLAVERIPGPPPVEPPVFDEPYYTGHYTEEAGLSFDQLISLTSGSHHAVVFALDGDHSAWFGLERISENSTALTLTSPIPSAVLANNRKLIFVITATRPGTVVARATIVISLIDEIASDLILGFEQVSYSGSIEHDKLTLEPIMLIEGFTQQVSFALLGDLATFFTVNTDGPTVRVTLNGVIPEHNIPPNRIIILVLRASEPQALPAFATIVLAVERIPGPPPVEPPVFDEPYYTGHYTEEAGLSFDQLISLTSGSHHAVVFALDGDHSAWFGLERISENSTALTLTSPIPSAVLANNRKLIFVITATRPGTVVARATIVISLIDEIASDLILGFEQVSYSGSIEHDKLTLEPIMLIEGFTQQVSFALLGDLATFFTVNTDGPTVRITLNGAIPEHNIPPNRIIILVLRASEPQALPAFATIVLAVERIPGPPPVEPPVFDEPYYTGHYTEKAGLSFDQLISLTSGSHHAVVFALDGDHSAWFGLERISENSTALTLTSPIPSAVLANNRKLIFVITATRPGTVVARATIVISLIDEIASDLILGFEQVSYSGSIEHDKLTLEPIMLIEGFTQQVSFALLGDLATFFTVNTDGPTVRVTLNGVIPEHNIPPNRIIILVLRASEPQALPAFATIVLAVERIPGPPPVEPPVFDEPYYTGHYTEEAGLSFDQLISLTSGSHHAVVFALDGDHSAWFGLERISENSTALTLTSPIPSAVLANNRKLIFVITATRPGTVVARATIVISLIDEIASDLILGFEQVSYSGSIEHDKLTLEPIMLIEGFTQQVSFALLGDLATFFTVNTDGPTVRVTLNGVIPEHNIPPNRIIILVLRASEPQALPAFATIVLAVERIPGPPPVEPPVFDEPYYTGHYTEEAGLSFDQLISLTSGSHHAVVFALDGDHSAWFGLERISENSTALTLTSPIPSAVLANNRKLIFVITATRPGTVVARATIVISLIDEIASDLILGFEQVSYSGSIEHDKLTLEPIMLIEGFTQQVSFALLGDLATFFTVNTDGPTVRITLNGAIPEHNIPPNRIIILVLRASEPQALPAFATIVLAVERIPGPPPVEPPVFDEPYYTGHYTEEAGLSFDQLISLTSGSHHAVVFALDGDHSAWFGLERISENSTALTLTSPIPSAVLANNRKLIFVITATRPGTVVARATIVISLIDEIASDLILGFEQVSYSGSIEHDKLTLEPIMLIEGFTQQVSFALLGDLATFFTVNTDGPTVRVTLNGVIPEHNIPPNRIIILVLRASEPQALPAFATIVLAVERIPGPPPVEPPVFDEPYYTGHYTEEAGLSFDQLISLTSGSHHAVVFALDGDHSAWFGLERISENSTALTLTSPIPSAVLANNRKLIFVITATRPGTVVARATIVISLIDEIASDLILGFEQVSYSGSIEHDKLTLEPIMLIEGFTQQVSFALLGDLATFFTVNTDGPTVRITLNGAIPEHNIPPNRIIILVLRASEPQALPAFATIVLAVERIPGPPPVEPPVFDEPYYTGHYTEKAGLSFDQLISLTSGSHHAVVFALDGDHSAWFGLERISENSTALTLTSPIPSAVLANNRKLIFVITATRPGTVVARATIVISLIDEIASDLILGFEQVSYSGSIEHDKLTLEPIMLIEGFTQQVSFALLGDLATFFTVNTDGPTVRITLNGAIPEHNIPPNRIIILVLRASEPQALPAFATIVLAVERIPGPPPVEPPVFDEPYYTGHYTEKAGLSFDQLISLTSGSHHAVVFALDGDHSAWFGLERISDNSTALTLTSPIPSAVLANNRKLIFVITATRPGTVVARATIVISLIDEIASDLILGFEQVSYSGSIEHDKLTLEPIMLIEGFTQQVSFALLGDLATFFTVNTDGPTVRVTLNGAIPEHNIPPNRIIILVLRASEPQALPAFATIVLAVERIPGPPPVALLVFAEPYYTGHYTEEAGLSFDQIISLSSGSDYAVVFALEGDHSAWFGLERISVSSTALTLSRPIPSAVLTSNRKLIFVITATRPGFAVARATIAISLLQDSVNEPKVFFDKVLYNGFVTNGDVSHEPISLSGYDGTSIQILGQYAELFGSNLSNGKVVITSKPSAVFPEISHIVLELKAGDAQAVLVLDVTESDTPVLPEVTFDSSSYVLKVHDSRTGLVGQVQATSDNGETITYSLIIDNEHLQQRLTVNSAGELRLSAPVTIGEYSFRVKATTLITQVSATAPATLTVEAASIIDDRYVSPLIILERDEEEPHRNLVLLNETQHLGCKYSLSNKWPENQRWLYVDSDGLHASSIDREDESIAFMALSQVQVELILECEGDVTNRDKRSLSLNSRTDWLGPYDYGSNKWILTNSIPYNARRSFVNLIVNDINDNTPIFVDKAKEPVAVGYPIAELEELILPRSLAELKATDADVGENAALVYWSQHNSLAVSPTTGFVHVRNNFNLENDARLIVHATDRNGAGLTGDLELVVKLLEANKIAVVTIRNAFLNDEEKILSDLTKAVGYEIKTLRTVVISESSSSERDNSDTTGTTIQMFAYGLIEREPVEVTKLATDISNSNIATVNIARTISLEDHLQDQNGHGRDTGLLAATISLSVLLFILIVAIAVWYFLTWRKKKLYERFGDRNSLESRNESVERPKQENVPKPRLNIEDLRKSERKLQERLQVPIVNVTVEPTTSDDDKSKDAIINIPPPEPQSPIIIQTIDKLKDNTEESEDDDEFGEGKKSRRKSVVTFNENVEKIIHIEDDPDIIPADDYEVFKL